MKKILWFVVGLSLLAGLGKTLVNSWDTVRFFQAKGRAATVKIGGDYQTTHWSSPLPLKRIRSYAATLPPNHEVVITTDQALKQTQEYAILFLVRDVASEGRALSIRPLGSSIRLKSAEDGTPSKPSATPPGSKALDSLLGPVGEEPFGPSSRPATTTATSASPATDKPSVPILLGDSKQNPASILWNNSTTGEWLVCIAWLLLAKAILAYAWVLPFGFGSKGSARKGFIHPSMRKIDPDAATPTPKIVYKPKARQPHEPGTPLKPLNESHGTVSVPPSKTNSLPDQHRSDQSSPLM